MNRKIFTLLAGTFLILAAVFNASAQSSVIPTMALQLGERVTKLQSGANEYYHLVVTGVSDGTGTSSTTGFALGTNNQTTNPTILMDASAIPAPLVLYLGKYTVPTPGFKKGNKSLPLFLAGLGHGHDGAAPNITKTDGTTVPNGTFAGFNWFDASAPKSRESASSLWCTVVNDYDQGQDVTFDFTNKFERDQLLEVDVTGYENWTAFTQGDAIHKTSDYYDYMPGNVAGWNFSKTYKTNVNHTQPLYSFITSDTVAVLCSDGIATGDMDAVYIKIAPIKDVLNNAVRGMLYFTLYKAAPFALSAVDFNSLLGSKAIPASPSIKLKFDPEVSSNPDMPNPFTKDGLWAEDLLQNQITAANFFYVGEYVLQGIPQPLYGTNDSPVDRENYAATPTSPAAMDALGYIYLRKNDATNGNPYLYVDTLYESGNLGGQRFLKFAYRKTLTTSGATYGVTATVPPAPTAFNLLHKDEALWGQSIWRLIYYPSGDSIYINPYQATYMPTDDPNMMVRDAGSLGTTFAKGSTINFKDPFAQVDGGGFTFRAKAVNLEAPVAPTGVTYPAGYVDMVGRLKYGKNPALQVAANNIPDFYTFYHHNYVTIQDLRSGNVKIATLSDGKASGELSTRIHFNIYSPCAESGSSDKTTVAQDLYLIRNELGQYLYVPLYSATDSAEWVYLEPNVHPELLPSFQWVVLKRSQNSSTSSIELINREYDGLRFGYIQLYKDKTTGFQFTGGNPYSWNNKVVNSNVKLFSKDDGKATFIQLDSKYKSDPHMGYTYIDSLANRTNVFSLNFGSGIDPNYYVSWEGDFKKYPNTDTTVYVYGQQDYEKLYFKLDTAKGYPLEKYGYKPAKAGNKNYIADLDTLERQPYILNFSDCYKFICSGLFSMLNGDQAEYTMGIKGGSDPYWGLWNTFFKDYTGVPVFNLRHYYHKDSNGDGKIDPINDAYFALVQRMNVKNAAYTNTDVSAFRQYLRSQFGSYVANVVIDIILNGTPVSNNNDYFKTGVMVAQFDDQTSKLKAQLRADNVTRVSTFRLQKDNDPIYRRFNVAGVDADTKTDKPKILEFYSIDYPSYKLFENTGQWDSQRKYWDYSGSLGAIKPIGKKNYLGYVNTNQYKDAQTAIYVDTAYINRPGGDIKPQYMLVFPRQEDMKDICDEFGNPIDITGRYLRGRYLINATDSARGVGKGIAWNSIATSDKPEYSGLNYLWNTNWERLIFVDAIHVYKKDALYFANWPGVTLDQYTEKLTGLLDTAAIEKASAAKDAATSKDKPIRKVFLGDNTHKDVVFSMRLMFRGADDFLIESETGESWDKDTNGSNIDRIWGLSYGRKNSLGPDWAPCNGGWVKVQDQIPMISRSDAVWNSPQGMGFNTNRTTAEPTSNDKVAVAAVTVIGGNNAVTILNAAGKKVVVSNVLGQTVASTVLTSDNVTLAAPAGVVVVAVEGSAPVKALVK